MKKYYILAAVALVASAACTKVDLDENIPAKKISFEVGNYSAQTKAHTLNSENITSFNCKAFLHAVGVANTQDFFGADGETIEYKSVTNTWEPASHDYYWPKSENSYVNFFSWYDTGNGPDSVTDGGMVWTNRTIAQGDNIMYADPAWHFQENTTNAKNAGDDDNITSGVPTVFHHALAKVNVKAYATKTSSNVCSWTIAIKNINITNVYTSGTLTLSATEPAASSKNTVGSWNAPAWSTTGNTSSIHPSNLASVTATTNATAQSILADQIVLPQSLTSSNLTFDLDITTTYGSGNDAVTHQEIIPFSIALGANGFNTASWALNTIYTYVIKISPSENKVYFDPAIAEEWAGPTEAEKAI